MQESIQTPTPAPESVPVPVTAVEPDGVEYLWQELGTKFTALNRDRLACGRILHELNEKYAVHGHGSFCKRVMGFGFFKNLQTAYNWMNAYRVGRDHSAEASSMEIRTEEGDLDPSVF